MRSNNRLLPFVLGAAVAAFCTGACKKASDTERENVDRAEARDPGKTAEVRKTEIRKADLSEKNDYLAAVRREQLDLRARLQAELDDIDKQLGDLKVDLHKDGGYNVDPKSKDAKRIQGLLQHRQQLDADVNTLERSDERGWDEIKANIEKDLSRRPSGKI